MQQRGLIQPYNSQHAGNPATDGVSRAFLATLDVPCGECVLPTKCAWSHGGDWFVAVRLVTEFSIREGVLRDVNSNLAHQMLSNTLL